MKTSGSGPNLEKTLAENEELRRRLEEAEDTLRAIRDGEVDAIVVTGSGGERVYSLAETENLHRLMVEAMNEVGIAATPDGVILFCNRRASTVFQRPLEEMLGKSLHEFVATHHTDSVERLVRDANPLGERVIFIARDGLALPMQVWATRVESQEGPIVCLVAADLSRLEADEALLHQLVEQQEVLRARERDLEKTQQELRDSHRELEEMVKQRTSLSEERGDKLRVMASALSSAEQDERRRLAQVLHDDLQQMLVAIRLRLVSLETAVVGTALGSTVAGINNIVESAINAARSLTTELSPPILREPLPQGLEWLARWFETRHSLLVTLTADAGVREPAAEAKKFLFQAVRELLMNVHKHAGTGHATVHVSSTADEIVITVRDEGKGFDPALATARDDNAFGLHSIRERVELLEGSFSIARAGDKGTICEIRMPALAPHAQHPKKERRGSTPAKPASFLGRPVRILVVDDHTIFRRGLISILESYPDLRVVGEAADGEEGVAKASSLLPDVVIMDLAMPRMNGIEATRIIKSRFQSVDVLALSFQESEHARGSVLEAGASDYFTKSGPLDDLLRAIRAHAGGDGGEAPPGDGNGKSPPGESRDDTRRA